MEDFYRMEDFERLLANRRLIKNEKTNGEKTPKIKRKKKLSMIKVLFLSTTITYTDNKSETIVIIRRHDLRIPRREYND